jgi:hypothetical protein
LKRTGDGGGRHFSGGVSGGDFKVTKTKAWEVGFFFPPLMFNVRSMFNLKF